MRRTTRFDKTMESFILMSSSSIHLTHTRIHDTLFCSFTAVALNGNAGHTWQLLLLEATIAAAARASLSYPFMLLSIMSIRLSRIIQHTPCATENDPLLESSKCFLSSFTFCSPPCVHRCPLELDFRLLPLVGLFLVVEETFEGHRLLVHLPSC